MSIKRALISVSDKEGILEFARVLYEEGVEILSTGGTSKLLKEGGVEVKDISDYTGFEECLDGRVKTLHPKVHGGILSIRDNDEHKSTMKKFNMEYIDLIVVNLYPFKDTINKEGVNLEEAIENIDIGGPTMLRSAAKNYKDVTVITNKEDYNLVIDEIKSRGETSLDTRYELALKVFELTSAYDSLIARYLRENRDGKNPKNKFRDRITFTYEKQQDLRYGENPNQSAAFYKELDYKKGVLTNHEQLQGKELSFNNINDTSSALEILKEFEEPTVVAIKHTNPCGVASAQNIVDAYNKCYNSDPQSIFGGIVALNREVNLEIAKQMNKIFLEVIIAPSFSNDALKELSNKKNLRVIKLDNILERDYELDIKKVSGGILLQDKNNDLLKELNIVTKKKPSKDELEEMEFAFKVVKHVKSNAIVITKNKATIAVGPGQTSRVWALENSIRNTENEIKGAVLASDGFFPFEDSVEIASKSGIKAIIQPGGSKNDAKSIEKCDDNDISMVFTGMRHFKH